MMRARALRVAIGVTILLAAACSGDEPRVTATVQGSSFARVAPAGAPVPFVVRNRWDRTVFLPTCGDGVLPVIDRLEDGRWYQYSGGACLFSSVQVPLELRAGQSDTSLTTIAQPGHYRLRVQYSEDASSTRSRSTTSGAFDVR